ncbi:MAG: DUF1592 domain-containing protein [Phycisphaerales bacterium]
MPFLREPASPWLALAGTMIVLGAAGALGLPPDDSADRPTTPPLPAADPAAAELERRFRDDVRPLLARSCFECHGETKSRADVRFDHLVTIADALDIADHLTTARELILARQMPPPDRPGLSEHEALTIQQWIDAALDYFPPDGAPDPGWFTIHRLNRAEYRNTLRDLLGIDPREFDVAAGLPADDTGYGFDNIAAVLAMSPLQLEAYLNAAERAIDAGVGPVFEVSTEPRPLRSLRITTGGHRLDRGGFLMYSNGGVVERVEIPVTGEYEVTMVSWGQPAGDEPPKLALRQGKTTLKTIPVEAVAGAPQTDRVRVRLKRGAAELGAHFINDYYVKDVADRNVAVESIALAGPLDASTVERPPGYARILFASPSAATPEAERAAAETILSRFASRAYRRPLTAEDVAGLMAVYSAARADGEGHETAVRAALAGVLVSPNFLYRTVAHPAPDDPAVVHTLSGHELASRLSYFLWSSTPDDELLGLAESGSLADERTLRGQVRRLLGDPRAGAFIENFAGQWLLLRNLRDLPIDTGKFPALTPEVREAMLREATMLFEHVVREDRPATELLGAGYTFLNEALARHYGVEGVSGGAFRRVELPAGSARGGLLGLGAVLTVTSNPTRTSPVKRGLYILDQILGSPPPPPPPDVPPLEQAAVPEGAPASLREQLRAHLLNPTCASCHTRMDPLGLALENFDAVGAWREADESGPIDASGELPGGERFVGVGDLRRLLLERRDRFIENLSRKLLTYALGRGLEPFDRPTVGAIVRAAGEREDRMSALIEAVVMSEAFRTCRGSTP